MDEIEDHLKEIMKTNPDIRIIGEGSSGKTLHEMGMIGHVSHGPMLAAAEITLMKLQQAFPDKKVMLVDSVNKILIEGLKNYKRPSDDDLIKKITNFEIPYVKPYDGDGKNGQAQRRDRRRNERKRKW